MRRPGKQPYLSRSWMIAALIGLVFAGLEYCLRFEFEGTGKAHSKLDLALLLGAYLFFFVSSRSRPPFIENCAGVLLAANAGKRPPDPRQDTVEAPLNRYQIAGIYSRAPQPMLGHARSVKGCSADGHSE